MTTLSQMLSARSVLLADGATGTNLFAQGLEPGEAPERWNLDAPEKITALHQSFVDAGSDLFLTNSFGGTRYRLALHGFEDRVVEVNNRAARLARQVADAAGRPVLVAGSIGPTGELIEPLGKISFEDARAAFAEQIEGLVSGGVDLLWVETISAPEELRAAVEAASAHDLPLCATMSFDSHGRTMMGLTPAAFVTIAGEFGLNGYGANCGVGVSDLMGSVLAMAKANGADVTAHERQPQILIAKANCGIPRFEGDKVVYDGSPQVMANYAVLARATGARIIGGCCGTTPAHVAAMRAALDDPGLSSALDVLAVTKVLGEMSDGARALAEGQAIRPAPAAAAPSRKRRARRS